jgi:hypothetical protein
VNFAKRMSDDSLLKILNAKTIVYRGFIVNERSSTPSIMGSDFSRFSNFAEVIKVSAIVRSTCVRYQIM